MESLKLSNFIHYFRRFAARQGLSSMVISDNAKTYRAAMLFLNRLLSNEEYMNCFEDFNVDWRFYLSKATWWVGFFERMMGCVKRTLYKTLRNSKLSNCELLSTLAEIVAAMINTSLTYVY